MKNFLAILAIVCFCLGALVLIALCAPFIALLDMLLDMLDEILFPSWKTLTAYWHLYALVCGIVIILRLALVAACALQERFEKTQTRDP